MVVDIVKSTELLKDADITALEKFNVFFIQYFYKALAEYGLVSLTPKFTGDGWIVTVEETIKAFNLIGVGKELILSLNRELKASGINFNGQVRFRIGLSCAADIRIQFGNITEYVGDSIRRATRVASVCRENEIWIDETLHTHLNRYFYLGPICINDIRKSNPKLDNDIELLKSVERCKLTNPDEQTEYLARIIRLEGVEPEAVTAVIEKAKRVQSQEEARSVEVAAIILGSAGHESATAIHRQLDHKGFGRDLSQWNLALYLATSFSAAKEIFEELKKKIVPDVKSYSTLVNKGDFEQGKALLAEMIAREIRPNEVTYSTLINKGDFEQGKALLAEMIARGFRPNEMTYSTLLTKDIGISRIEDVMKWLGDQPGFRPHYIEPQIKRLQNNLRMEEAYYLILCWPHLGASKKLLATNVELAKAAFNKIKGKDPDSFGNNFNYAIGIGYFLQNNGKKATYHLRKALEEAKAEPRKKHIEEMLKHIENNA